MLSKTTATALVVLLLALPAQAFSAEPAADQSTAQTTEQATDQANSQPAARKGQPRKKLFPDDVAGLQALAIKSYEEGNHLRFMQATMKLREKRPYEPQYLAGMVIGAALLNRPRTAYNYMHKMQQQGLAYDFNSTDDTLSIRDTEVYTYINDLLIKAEEPMGVARVAFTLPAEDAQPEAIAWDPSREKFLVGSVDSGTVWAVGTDGNAKALIEANDDNGLWAITGIAVDAQRKRLWLSSAALPAFKKLVPTDLGRGALFEFDLASLKLLKRYFVPVDGLPHVPASPVVTPDGDVFVIDRAMPLLFQKAADADALTPYLANKDLVGFRDMTLSDSGTTLYLADAAKGIMVVDLKIQGSGMLGVPDNLNLAGISGLSFKDGNLFMLQNGIRPQRLMRLELDPSGLSVNNVAPLASGSELFNAPSLGTVHGDHVYYFASSNMPGANEGPAEVRVLVSPLLPDKNMIPVEQRKFNEDTFGNPEGKKAKKN